MLVARLAEWLVWPTRTVVQYDKGAWEGEERLNFRGNMSSVPGDLIVAVNNFRAKGSSKTNVAEVLKQMRLKLDDKR
jgi:hypothetical protein